VLSLKVLIFELTLISTAERSFHCVYAWNLKFTPHRYSRCGLLAEIVRESRVFKAEVVAEFGDYVRENTGLVGHFIKIVAVHKDVLFATVPVQIAVKHDFSLFFELPNQTFNCKIFRVQSFK